MLRTAIAGLAVLLGIILSPPTAAANATTAIIVKDQTALRAAPRGS